MAVGKESDMNAALGAMLNVFRIDPNYHKLAILQLWRGDMYYKHNRGDDLDAAREAYSDYLKLGGKDRSDEIKKRLQELP
jgi:hypothetical protein